MAVCHGAKEEDTVQASEIGREGERGWMGITPSRCTVILTRFVGSSMGGGVATRSISHWSASRPDLKRALWILQFHLALVKATTGHELA